MHVAIAKVLSMEIAPPGRVSNDGVVWFSIDMVDYGAPSAARLARGCVAGILDILLLWHGRAFVIEVKAQDGRLSDAQRSIIAATLSASGSVAVARDWVEVLRCLDQWEIPRARRVREAA